MDLPAFAQSYTVAWGSQDPARVAAHFSADGSLAINGGAPAIGREAIAAVAQSFMTAIPNLALTLDDLRPDGDRFAYHWTFTGTYAATGRPVRVSGYESWLLSPEGLIAASFGHFDAEDYARQTG